jgi:DNA-binding NarL/FixJ family response regulator
VDAAERNEILSRYADHARRFEAAAARRSSRSAEIIPFTAPLRELEQEPTPREVLVLQLISEGLVNREIGKVLFLSEETVKSHVRHLLAKLQARSRAHASNRLSDAASSANDERIRSEFGATRSVLPLLFRDNTDSTSV